MNVSTIFDESSSLCLDYDHDVRDLDRFLIRNRAARALPIPIYYEFPLPSFWVMPIDNHRILSSVPQDLYVQLEPIKTKDPVLYGLFGGRFYRHFYFRLQTNQNYLLWRIKHRKRIMREIEEHNIETAQGARVRKRIMSLGEADMNVPFYTIEDLPNVNTEEGRHDINTNPQNNDEDTTNQEGEAMHSFNARYRIRRGFSFALHGRNRPSSNGDANDNIHDVRQSRAPHAGIRNALAHRSRTRSRARLRGDIIRERSFRSIDQALLEADNDTSDNHVGGGYNVQRRQSSRHFFRRTFHSMLRRNQQEMLSDPSRPVTRRSDSLFVDDDILRRNERDPDIAPAQPEPLRTPESSISAGSGIISSGSENFHFTNEEINRISNTATALRRSSGRETQTDTLLQNRAQDIFGASERLSGVSLEMPERSNFDVLHLRVEAPTVSNFSAIRRELQHLDQDVGRASHTQLRPYEPARFDPPSIASLDPPQDIPLMPPPTPRIPHATLHVRTPMSPPVHTPPISPIQLVHSSAASRRNSSGTAIMMNQRRDVDASATQSIISNRSDGNRDEIQLASRLRRSLSLNTNTPSPDHEIISTDNQSTNQLQTSNEENSKHSSPEPKSNKNGRRTLRHLRGTIGRFKDIYLMMGRYDDKSGSESSPDDITNATTSSKSYELMVNSGTSSNDAKNKPRFSPLKLSPINPKAFDFSDV